MQASSASSIRNSNSPKQWGAAATSRAAATAAGQGQHDPEETVPMVSFSVASAEGSTKNSNSDSTTAGDVSSRHKRLRFRAQSLGDVLSGGGGGGGGGNDRRRSQHPMRPLYRTHTRMGVFRGAPQTFQQGGAEIAIVEPEIEAVVEEGEEDEDEVDSVFEGGKDETSRDNESSQKRAEKNFCTRDKLERGTLSAFKREARNIIDRDMPHVSHRDNIIRVFIDRGHSHFLSAASKPGPLMWLSFQHFDQNFKYYFQHPYLRLLTCYTVILCNLLLFAEDPLSHSKREADIPVMGNVFSFIFTKYPSDWRWQFLKVSMWLLAIGCGLIVGKTLIHGIILSRFLRLKMFRADQGSWMVQFFTVIVSLFLFSHAYNLLLVLTLPQAKAVAITSKMYFSNSSVMKAAACGTWLGAFISAMIITDMMLQDNLYPAFAPRVRKFWQSHAAPRILLFWVGAVFVTSAVVTVIATDLISWDGLNRDFFATTELSRAFLASFILVMDLTIVMQDWDFPHFTNTLDVNLPGFYKHEVNFQAVEIEISGKWFNYGIMFFVMLFDLNMWKNQIFYRPERYGQYTGLQHRVYTVTNETVLEGGDPRAWSYGARAQINPDTGMPHIDEDLSMYSRYMGYPMWVKSMAFIPCIVGFIIFFVLIAVYGRISGAQEGGGERGKGVGGGRSFRGGGGGGGSGNGGIADDDKGDCGGESGGAPESVESAEAADKDEIQ